MKHYHINIFYSQEDEGYIADIPDLKYCSGFGLTEEEVKAKGISYNKGKFPFLANSRAIGKPT